MFGWYDYCSGANKLMRVNYAAMLVIILFIEPLERAHGEPIVLQNDTVTEGVEGAIQAGFLPYDVGAAVFELLSGVDALRIDRIQILFLSYPAHALHTFGSVHLYCGTLPDPGAPQRTAGGVGLNPDFFNEIDVSNENWMVWAQDGPFAVGLEYLWKVGGDIDPASGHLVTDQDGCQPGKNLAYDSITETWLDACPYTGGDFVIRVVGEPLVSKAPFGDFDDDGDVDHEDFGVLQRCITGEGGTATSECGLAFDCDRDGDVDGDDLEQYVACASAPQVQADPSCGLCLPESACLGALGPLLCMSSNQERWDQSKLAWISWIVLIAIAALVFVGIRSCYIEAHLTAAKLAFISAGVSLTSQDKNKVRDAILYLRDDLGATDPEAHRAGQFLWDNEYHTDCCLVQKVPLGQNPKNLTAVNPPGTPIIVVYEEFLTYRYFRELLAMILYAEWCHIDDPGPSKEDAQEQKLQQFRQRHAFQNLAPEIRHGASEGSAE